MDDQIILAVDEAGKFLEYIPKSLGHQGKGRRHLAITVLIQNSQGQVLLQKRKHQIFDNIWDFTGATHPLHKTSSCHPEQSEGSSMVGEDSSLASSSTSRSRLIARNDENKKTCNDNGCDETLEEATWRCLEVEYGIKEKISLKNLGSFNYFAQDGNCCENEHCYLLVGEYDGEINMDPKVGYEFKWVNKEQFLEDAAKNPQNYAPWVREGIQLLGKGR